MTQIEETLKKIFKENRVVFWYDEEEKMRKEFETLSLADIDRVEVNNNQFALKHQILRGASSTKYLLYFPYGEPPYEENWLLDIQLAHKEFYTDQEAMYLQEMEMDYYLKEVVKEHIAFFENKERRAKLKELVTKEDAKKEIQFKMLAVLFNTEYPNLGAYVQAYSGAFMDENTKIDRNLERYNLKHFFWKAIEQKFDYHSEVPTIYDFLLDIFSRNFSLTNKGRSVKETRILLSLWKDALSSQESFKQVSAKISKDLRVNQLLEEATVEDVLNDDLFEAIDKKIIHDLAYQLVANTINVETITSYIKKRENKYWFPTYNSFYACLQQAAYLFAQIEKETNRKVEGIVDIARIYSKELFTIDYHYRQFIFHFRQTGQNSTLDTLKEKVLKTYSNDWLLPINNKLQDQIAKEGMWIQESQKAQARFFDTQVQPFIEKPQRIIVVISDALRYENGWQLVQELQAKSRFEAALDYMITSLPCYTQLGMAALLPHKVLNIHPKDCSVLVDGMSSIGLPGRTKILQANTKVRATAIDAENFMKMNSAKEGKPFIRDHDLIYIYHNRIDKIGDDKNSEDKVFEAVEEEIKFLKELLRKIASFNGINILLTSDHGYIYQHEKLAESEFSEAKIKGDVWKKNRRFVIGRNLTPTKALQKFNGAQVGLSNDIDILTTKSINRLRVSGAGSRFIHGGATLQETIIPLVRVAYKKKGDTTKIVEIDLIKSTDKITTNILAVSFLQKELVSDTMLPRTIRASLQAEDGTILSDSFNYVFDATTGSERQREVKHRFQLSNIASTQYKNQRVSLVLENKIEDSSQWNVYKKYHYTLNISFTNDFDDF